MKWMLNALPAIVAIYAYGLYPLLLWMIGAGRPSPEPGATTRPDRTAGAAPALVTTVRNGGYLFAGDVKDI